MFRTIIKQIRVWIRKIWSRKTLLANNDENTSLSPEKDSGRTLETSDEMTGNSSDIEDQRQHEADPEAPLIVETENGRTSDETSAGHTPPAVNDDLAETKSAESDKQQDEDDKWNIADNENGLSEKNEQPQPKPEESDKVVKVTESPHSSEDEDHTDHSTTPSKDDLSEAKIKEKENGKISDKTSEDSTSQVVNNDLVETESDRPDKRQDDKWNAVENKSELSELVEQSKPNSEESSKEVEVTESSHSSKDEESTDHSKTPTNRDSVGAKTDGKKLKQKTPRKIGGRRSSSTSSTHQVENDAADKTIFIPRPELICYKPPGSRQWEIVLSVPQECNIVEVRHNDTPLSTANGEYRPLSFSGVLSVKYDDLKPDEFPLSDGKTPLIFKLRGDWEGTGRKMRDITQGHFIVIAPGEWTRTGHVSVEAQGCADTKYLAHYFFQNKNDPTTDVGDFKEYDMTLTQTGIQLSGTCIFDDSKDGDLFAGSVPRLNSASGILWVRMGEEKQGGWPGENFKPAEKSLADVLNGREGRFFIRVYDEETKLIDSQEFRYCSVLSEIRVNGEQYTQDMVLPPPSDGHAPTTLQFVGIDGNTIHPVLSQSNLYTTMGSDGVVTVAPDPDGDEIACSLKSNTGSVDVVIKLPRIWWRIERDDGDTNDWHDTPTVMTRDEFRQHANAGAVMRLHLPPYIRRIHAGFGDDLDRSIPVENGLALEDFVDYAEIDNFLTEDASFRVQCDGEIVLTLIRVTADLPPTQPDAPQKNFCARVKCASGGWRRGKGFSRGELRDAGFSYIDAVCLRIPIDKRRHSIHYTNIETLREVESNA